ncbi:MAG: 3-oxoadipate enol-lactonase [Candidatus Acidiferrales bacterium]|jgi:3-oxoadipate enol-lactonase/4-carboxymuconolactone decarboxylase
MPFATIEKTRLYYRLEGNAGLPVLVLSHSIGCDHGLWAQQVPDLLQHFQVLRYDTRGHGASDAPKGDYSVEQLGRDVLDLADALGIAKFAFCGLSLGGMIGQWLGFSAPERLTGLVLANTSPRVAPKSNWDDRRRMVLEGGMAAIADIVMQRFFLPETLAEGNPYVNSARAVILGTDPVGYAGCCSAIRDMDHTGSLGKIRVPTLVIAGDCDVSTPWAGHGEILARDIPGARAAHLPTAHLSNVERPRSFTAAIYDLLRPEAAPGNYTDPIDEGFAVRRSVLGDAHVDRSIETTTDFNREFQELIARYAWGTVWTRPGLDRRTRRLLVLAMMATLGRWEEFRMHVRAALEHGFEPCDVKELLLQSAIYAGVPVANAGFHIATEEIEKLKPRS